MSEYLSKEEIKQWRSSLEKITLEELDEAIKNVDREYMEMDNESEEIYDIKKEEKYYFNEDYYDFYLHKSENKTAKKNNKLKDDIGVAA